MATSAPEYETSAEHYGDEPKRSSSDKSGDLNRQLTSKQLDDGRFVLQDTDAWEVLGYSFPTWRKWQILGVVFLIQISMNLNASMYVIRT
jgi:hypothetical protein